MSEYFIKVDELPEREYRVPSMCSVIIKEFLESGIKIVKLNKKNIPLKAPSNGLRDYIRDNKISNVKVFQRRTDVYLMRI
jgi:hypothetical protein